MSKFGNLRDARNRAAEPAAPVTPPPCPAPVKTVGPGSRGGKRDDPAYSQATAYLPAKLLHRVKGRLHEERGLSGRGRDLSDLIAELLTDWLDTPNN